MKQTKKCSKVDVQMPKHLESLTVMQKAFQMPKHLESLAVMQKAFQMPKHLESLTVMQKATQMSKHLESLTVMQKATQMPRIPKLPVFPSLESLAPAQRAVQMPRIPNFDSLTQGARSAQSRYALTQAKQLRCSATFIFTYGIADGARPVTHALKRRGKVVYTTWEEFSEVEINIQMSWYE